MSAVDPDRLLVDRLEGFTKAILRPKCSGGVELVGSGSVLKVADRLYLLTAAHVLDLADEKMPLLLQTVEKLVPVSGTAITSPKSHARRRSDDQVDLAVVALPSEYLAHFPIGSYLTESNLETDRPVARQKGFLFLGYPESKNRKVARALSSEIAPFLYGATCHEAQESMYAKLKLSPSDSLLLTFDPKRMRSRAGDKRPPAPSLRGLSGTPIWGVTADGVGVVVSVLIEHHKAEKKCVISTRVSRFLDAISTLQRLQMSGDA